MWLTHWGRDEMDIISQTTFSNAFSWMKMYELRLRFHWSLFLRVQLKIIQHWFRWWLGAVQATSHYLNQWWLYYWRIYASLGLNELKQLQLWSRYPMHKTSDYVTMLKYLWVPFTSMVLLRSEGCIYNHTHCFMWDVIAITVPGSRFNIKMTSYQYRKSHCGNICDHLISTMRYSILVW